MSDKKWYVLQVFSGREKKVKKAIEENKDGQGVGDLIDEIVIPTENVSEVKKGQQRITEKKIWPGYILIKMDFNDNSWSFINKTNDVLGFLGGSDPAPLAESEIQSILSDIEEKKKGVVQKHKVEVGDVVKIIDGVFVNFQGTVLEVNHEKGRLSVMVSIFGRDTRVDDLEFWQVEQVTKE
jgi:transcription termination/antitermination protein NusG